MYVALFIYVVIAVILLFMTLHEGNEKTEDCILFSIFWGPLFTMAIVKNLTRFSFRIIWRVPKFFLIQWRSM